MTRNALRLALIVGIVTVATAYLVLTRHQETSVVAPVAATSSDGPPAIPMTGNYSDDWQTACGPVMGPAQADCTARLDARYGRVAGAPLPAEKR